MVNAQRFAFQPFSEPAVNRPAAAEVPAEAAEATAPPTILGYTEEELQAAEKQGYDRGFAEGFRTAETQARTEAVAREEALVAATQQAVEQTAQLLQSYQQYLAEERKQVAALALSIARQWAAYAVQQNPIADIEGIAQECLHGLLNEPKVTVSVHHSLATPMRKRMEETKQQLGFAGELIVQGDAALALGDIRLEWRDGKAERSGRDLQDAIERIVTEHLRFLPAPAHAAAENVHDTPSHLTIIKGE